ncbi:MAG: HEPN domain-containing protein [Janthinobacterium svalbardensis]
MEEKKSIIDEQGHFWWRDEPIPEKDFAPENHVTGRLVIAQDGYIQLELDGLLPTGMHPWEQIFGNPEGKKTPRQIQGILKKSGSHILLLDAIRVGGQASSNRFSYEKYFSSLCLVGQTEFPRIATLPRFSNFEVDLNGYEAWLQHGTLKVDLRQRTFSVKGKVVSDLVFNTEFGRLTFIQNTEFPDSGRLHLFDLRMREFVTLSVKHKKTLTAENIRDQHSKIQELMMLLTDSHYSLAWPTVKISREKYPHTLYFHRAVSSAAPPEQRYLPTLFYQFRENFGDIFSSWSHKRDVFGAGFYSYASTRRDVKLYVENRFINLVQGLESFHRTKYGDQPPTSNLQTKINRIIKQISEEKDKTWLEKKLQHAGEPTLAERLFKIFNCLPFQLEEKRMRKFCNNCADVRNDLAHLGGKRTREKSSNYLSEIGKLSDALTFLYHMTLLREIGVADNTLQKWLHNSFRSTLLKSSLVETDLLPPDILQLKSQ